MGEGRAVLLLHGLFSNADVNWVRYGTAKKLADAGYRVVMPDFRGHGKSDAPDNAAAWPDDVLSKDIEALIPQLDLGDDFLLGGYSMGARTTVRLLTRGARPAAVMLAGMGLEGLTVGWGNRADWFIRVIKGRDNWQRGEPEFLAAAFLKANVSNPDAMIHLLQSQQPNAADELGDFTQPTLVVCGADDRDNGSATALAEALPNARYAEIPGNHMASVTRPELAAEMIRFLQAL